MYYPAIFYVVEEVKFEPLSANHNLKLGLKKRSSLNFASNIKEIQLKSLENLRLFLFQEE